MIKRSQHRAIAALLLLAAWALSTTGALAAPLQHPAPSVMHDYVVNLTPTEMSMVSYLRISPELVPEVYRQIDLNNDGRTSDDERAAWVEAHPAKLQLTLNSKPQQPTLSPAPPLAKED